MSKSILNGKTVIERHSWKPYQDALAGITAALSKMDGDLRALARRQDLFPEERQRREYEAREAGKAAVTAARARLTNALTADRERCRYVERMDAETVARRSYCAQIAAADLQGMGGAAALQMAQNLVDAGDTERAAEYVRASRVSAEQAGLTATWAGLQRAVTPPEAKAVTALSAALDNLEANTYWLDRNIDSAQGQAGHISEQARKGLETETALDTRVVSMWMDRAARDATDAAVAKVKELDAPIPPAYPMSAATGADVDAPAGDGGEVA